MSLASQPRCRHCRRAARRPGGRVRRRGHAAQVAVNPLLPAWTGPHGGVPPFDQSRSSDFSRRSKRHGRAARGDRAHRQRTRPRRRSRTPSPRWNAPAGADRAGTVYSVCSSTLNDHRRAGGRARDGAEAGRVPRPDHAERAALRAHRGGLRGAREAPASRPSSSARLVALHQLRARRRQLDAAGQEAPRRRSTSGSRRCSRSSARTCSPTRTTTVCCSTRRRTSPACPSPCAPRAAAAAEARGQKGKWAVAQHALVASSRS